MSIRRLFWLGAAILFSIAALVAIAAVVGGHFGETQGRILATCGLAFICGAAILSGFACLEREVIRPAAWVAIALGVSSFAVWAGGVWKEASGSGYWKTAGVLGVWLVAALIATTLRLVASSPRLLRSIVPATWVATVVAAAVGTSMIVRQDDSGSGVVKLEIVLVILMVLGYALTPALQKFWGAAETAPAAERLLGTIGDVDVYAVRGEARWVTFGTGRAQLASSEGIVLRERT